ncbi:methyltransferase [Paraburkholderia acidicola]|uniref:methyltransferase n=1 Tax=Paraburkholderia acidicola TaxID=1912599 RepID=UPI000BBC0DA9|nr:class I SAM-dependent methyltransferase [Paraburkholderia acidicola]
MNHKEKLLAGLNISTGIGAEIGALCRPIVSRSDGAIYYVDHASTADLREKYKNDPQVDTNAIVDVDAVWGKQSLSEALGGKCLDYVIASHVIEHVPDLVGWLTEVSAVLKPNGQLRLAVPDKRFTFDLKREESRLSDVLSAYVVRARIPQPQAVIDHILNVRYDVSVSEIWLGRSSNGRPAHTFADAIGTAQDAFTNGHYHDVHCWVFTPAGFARICRQLVENNLLRMSCAKFFDTARNELEFHVHMQECADVGYAAATWEEMEKLASPLPPRTIVDWRKLQTTIIPKRLHNVARRLKHRLA